MIKSLRKPMALRLLKRCKWWYNYDMDSKRDGKILMAKSKEGA